MSEMNPNILVNAMEFLASTNAQTGEVPVPECGPGRKIAVRSVNTEVIGRAEAAMYPLSKDGKTREYVPALRDVVLVLYGAVDAASKPLFTEDQLTELQAKRGGVIRRIAAKIAELSGLDVDVEAEERKNSPATGTSETPTA